MRNSNTSVFKDRLKEMRTVAKMSQKELAKILDLDSSTVANYETGNRQPDYENLIKIAEHFGVSTDWLIGRTNNPQVSNIELAVKGLEPRIQKILLEDKDNALPFLALAADCVESGYSLEHVRELLKNIFIIREKLRDVGR